MQTCTLTEKMKEFFDRDLAMITTVSNSGEPNVGPKRSARVLDDHRLIFNENTGGKTYKNILENKKVVVAIANLEKLQGYRFVCEAEVYTDGEYMQMCTEYAFNKYKAKAPKAAIVLNIKEIHTLQIGPLAGKMLQPVDETK